LLANEKDDYEIETRVMLWMNLGHYYMELLIFSVQNFLQNQEAIPEVVSHQSF